MILYGRNPLREALRGRRAAAVHDIWATQAAAREPWLEGRSVRICLAEDIERRCGSASHQGMCADSGPYPYVDALQLLARVGQRSEQVAGKAGREPGGAGRQAGEAEREPGRTGHRPREAGQGQGQRQRHPLIVVLDQVQDPQNLGSICRTAECAGAAGLVIAERRSAEVTPAVCKASAGAVEHLPVARVRNIADFLIAARDHGCWSYGASAPGGERRTVPYTQPDYSGGGVLLVLGSEGDGLRPRVADACDQLISLPMRGRTASLGVAAAAAALMYGILQALAGTLDKSP